MSTSDFERERAANRARMPETARYLDELRAVFGKVKVLWAVEGDHAVGTPPESELKGPKDD
jgi:hypothetical protein